MAKNRQTRCKGCGARCRYRRRGPSYCPDCQEAEDLWKARAGGRYTKDPQYARSAGQTTLLEETNLTKQDAKLIERAVRERWPIGRRIKQTVIHRLRDIVEKREVTVMGKEGPFEVEAPADSNSVAAARVLVAMVGQNQADEERVEKRGQPKDQINVNVGVQTNINVAPLITRELLNDPDYLDYERQRASQADIDPGIVRPVRQPGALEISPPPNLPRPGNNGHANGQGR